MPEIEFFFDVGSPYTYLAFHRLPDLAARCGVSIEYRPFLLGAVFKAAGNAPPAMVPARGKWMYADLHRWAARCDVPFVLPTCFPINSLLPMRALTALNPDELRGGAEKVFHAYWGEGRDVSDPSLLIELLGADVVEMASADQVKQKLRATTDDAISRGAFGAPTFFVGDQLFFGNDRLDFIEDLLMKQD